MLVFRYNRVLIALIIIGLVAASFVTWQRHVIERANVQVELVSDYDEIVEMARIDGFRYKRLFASSRAPG